MKIKLICGFKLKQENFLSIENSYLKRLKNEFKLEIIEIPHNKSQSADEIKKKHCAELLAKSSPTAFKILLAEDGKALNSLQCAKLIQEKMLIACPEIHFFIGGPYGIAQENYKFFNLQLSISLMTLTAEFCRVLLIEQIYRTQCIISGVPYHKE